MKKLLLPIMASLVMAFMSSSCDKEYILESMQTDVKEFVITNDMWSVDASTDDLYCERPWGALTSFVMAYGNVQAYLYEGDRQVPLPYVYPVTFYDGAGAPQVRPLNVRFDMNEGTITFIITDCGEFLTDQRNLYTMRFRAVATWPVNYIVED
jgi:hypothetical protein